MPHTTGKRFITGRTRNVLIVLVAVLLVAVTALVLSGGDNERTVGDANVIRDATGEPLNVPDKVDRVICSGSGCLRLLTYLKAHDRIVAVDSIERRGSPLDARPYAIANPQFKKYPLFGEFRGWDNPELIAGLSPPPQLIFKTAGGRGQDPAGLQEKTGIPVVVLDYGNLTHDRGRLEDTLRRMGTVMGKSERVKKVLAYFNTLQRDLAERTQDIPRDERPSCYIGGLGHSGPHGIESTDPSFAPFEFTHALNVASQSFGEQVSHASVAKEQIVLWDPDVIFIDVSTLRLEGDANALHQLRNDSSFQSLSAVRERRVYGLFPSKSYNENLDAVFANAYYVGKVLYPERFADVDPIAKAEEISTFLNGGEAFKTLNREFNDLAFRRIQIK